MLNVKINTPEGCIRLDSVGLSIRQGDVHVYLTAREYAWLPVYYAFGQDLTLSSEGGTIVLLSCIASALVWLIKDICNRRNKCLS